MSTIAAWSGAEGHPAVGSVMLTIPFTAPSQAVQLALNFPAGTMDMTGKIVTVQVMFQSGPANDTTAGGGIKLYAKSGSTYVYADGGYNPVPALATWVSAGLNMAAPSYVDPAGTFLASDITELGVEIDTGSSGAYTTAVAFVDTFADRSGCEPERGRRLALQGSGSARSIPTGEAHLHRPLNGPGVG
jgi:hypothetical protein